MESTGNIILEALGPNASVETFSSNTTMETLSSNDTFPEPNKNMLGSFLNLEKNIFVVLLVVSTMFSFLASSRVYHYLQLITCHDNINSSQSNYSTQSRRSKSSGPSSQTWICLSGGIFLCLLFLDLFPTVDLHMSHTHVHSERFPQFVVVTSFLAVMLIEQAVMQWKEMQDEKAKSGCDETSPLLSTCRETLLSQNTVRSLFLVFSLSLHNGLEGLALGRTWHSLHIQPLTLATVLYKSLMSSCVGFSLARLSPTLVAPQSLLYCCSSLVGVIVGLLTCLKAAGAKLTVAVLHGAAAGIFLYILFFEILPHQLNGPGRRLEKVFFATCGFLAAAAIVIFI